jgi:hypothetical protein
VGFAIARWVLASDRGHMEEDSASSCAPAKLVPRDDPGGMQMGTHLTIRIARHIDHDVDVAGENILDVRQPILVYVMAPSVLISFEITVERRWWAT